MPLLTRAVLDLSIVSHGHGFMVMRALRSFCRLKSSEALPIRVILTLNLPEPILVQEVNAEQWPFELEVIENLVALGFGANHNKAFLRSSAPWFAVVNPDVELQEGCGHFLHGLVTSDGVASGVGLLCPTQLDRRGAKQDFARRLVTPWRVLVRTWQRQRSIAPLDIALSVREADWVNGACMVIRREAFVQLKGFDERYHMYCEDVDVCLRLQLAGWSMQETDWTVLHDAQRNTRRNWLHLAWHVKSLMRLWGSGVYWQFSASRHR